jgi:hypothetical protein
VRGAEKEWDERGRGVDAIAIFHQVVNQHAEVNQRPILSTLGYLRLPHAFPDWKVVNRETSARTESYFFLDVY